ncbi:MAG: bifunctional phosphopantothenoylcysteine decarboxylase/phosphopantothenate--cysteine ligase CoaBC [Fimbriimonadaceae bacterium]
MDKNAILGVCGSVAAYRAADLARELMRRGYAVRVCLTGAAQHFVTAELFEALTGQPCLSDVFDEPSRGRMAHIDWARWANVVVVAPATSTTLSRLAYGIGEDMLTALALATRAPLVLAPAMNPTMHASDPTQGALRILRGRAAVVVEPVEGDVACGENGHGKLASIETIVEAVEAVTCRAQILDDMNVLITSGPTHEPLDDVRILTNRSSGKMGAALCRGALLLGAKVAIVSGPSPTPLPMQAEIVRVKTALEMLAEVERLAPEADVIIGAAAVADYRPAERVHGKVRRTEKEITLKLVPNPDILAGAVAKAKPGATIIGFAAEPSDHADVARKKLAAKGLAAVAMNDISRADAGFESDANELTLLFPDGSSLNSGHHSKLECALWLLESVCKRP